MYFVYTYRVAVYDQGKVVSCVHLQSGSVRSKKSCELCIPTEWQCAIKGKLRDAAIKVRWSSSRRRWTKVKREV
jgi:hypothetical protein